MYYWHASHTCTCSSCDRPCARAPTDAPPSSAAASTALPYAQAACPERVAAPRAGPGRCSGRWRDVGGVWVPARRRSGSAQALVGKPADCGRVAVRNLPATLWGTPTKPDDPTMLDCVMGAKKACILPSSTPAFGEARQAASSGRLHDANELYSQPQMQYGVRPDRAMTQWACLPDEVTLSSIHC